MNKMLKYVMFAMAIALAFVATDASAQNVFGTITQRMITTFQSSRSVIFIVGGFGLIGLGFAAIFGKVNWKWLAALACGLAIVAVAGQVVDYVTRSDASQNAVDRSGERFIDTLDRGEDGGYGAELF